MRESRMGAVGASGSPYILLVAQSKTLSWRGLGGLLTEGTAHVINLFLERVLL